MTKTMRARYTLEFKEEAVRLVKGGERQATVAKNLGLSEQTLHGGKVSISPVVEGAGLPAPAYFALRYRRFFCSRLTELSLSKIQMQSTK